jgi:hypothetical protein
MIGSERVKGRENETAVLSRQGRAPRRQPPDVYQVVVECRDEAEQRELFERMRGEGRRVRLLVL